MTRFEKLTAARVHAMSGSELEQYAERWETNRCDLSREVVHQLNLPAGWQCDIEYRSEFGFSAPVCIRLKPVACSAVDVFLFSSSDDVPFWRMCLPFCDGECAAWIYSSEQFEPDTVSTVLASVRACVCAGLTTPERVAAAMRRAGGAV